MRGKSERRVGPAQTPGSIEVASSTSTHQALGYYDNTKHPADCCAFLICCCCLFPIYLLTHQVLDYYDVIHNISAAAAAAAVLLLVLSNQALDYYDIIHDPVDLLLIGGRLASKAYYVSLEMFVADVRKMCDNCK
jgi:hypothetical protein